MIVDSEVQSKFAPQLQVQAAVNHTRPQMPAVAWHHRTAAPPSSQALVSIVIASICHFCCAFQIYHHYHYITTPTCPTRVLVVISHSSVFVTVSFLTHLYPACPSPPPSPTHDSRQTLSVAGAPAQLYKDCVNMKFRSRAAKR